MIDKFSDWLVSKQAEIDNVATLLSTQLSSEPAELIDDLTAIEVWNSRVGELLAHANTWLDTGKRFYLPERLESQTEADRRAFVDDKVSDIRKTRDILESLADCIKQRLILGESILRWEKPHATPEINNPRSAADILRGK